MGTPTQAATTSTVHDSGFLHGSTQAGAAVVTMYNTSGDIQWSERISIPGVPPLRGIQTLELIDGGPAYFILLSSFASHPHTISERYYLIEFDDLHQPVFAISLEDTASNCGLTHIENARIGHAQRIAGQGYLINEPSSNNFNCVCSVGVSGIPQWWRAYSAADWTTDDNRYFMGFFGCSTLDGGLILPNSVEGGFHLHRLDQLGNIVWAKKYITGNPYDQAWHAAELPDGNIIVTGMHGENVSNGAHWLMLLKLTSGGDIIWHRRISKEGSINYPGFPYEMRVGVNGDILIRTLTWGGDNLIRCDGNGVVQEMVYLEQEVGFQEGVVLDMLPSTELILSGSVQSDLGPITQENPFFSISPDLASIQCNTESVNWIDEAYPTNVVIEETGAALNYIHWTWSSIDVEVSPMQWTREILCSLIPTGASETLTLNHRVLPTLLLHGDIITLEHQTQPKSVELLDSRGASVPFTIQFTGNERTQVAPTNYVPGMYILRASWQDNLTRNYKIMIMD
jgi:hypothetical protein